MRDFFGIGIGIAVFALTGCVAVTPTAPELRSWAEVSPVADCPYLNVFVESEHEHPEKEKFYPGWQDAEPHRAKFLDSAARSIPQAGWRIVSDPEDAAFLLAASGSVTQGASQWIQIQIAVTPTHRTIHHAFVASLNDPSFPLREEGFGSSLTLTVSGSYTDVEMQNQINRLLEFTQAQAFPTVAALCETRAQLTEEGTSLEELRMELIEEIHRVRRTRKREKQTKELKLGIEAR